MLGCLRLRARAAAAVALAGLREGGLLGPCPAVPTHLTQPLRPPPAEVYVNETAKERPVVTWNMELDTLRSDLGATV